MLGRDPPASTLLGCLRGHSRSWYMSCGAVPRRAQSFRSPTGWRPSWGTEWGPSVLTSILEKLRGLSRVTGPAR